MIVQLTLFISNNCMIRYKILGYLETLNLGS